MNEATGETAQQAKLWLLSLDALRQQNLMPKTHKVETTDSLKLVSDPPTRGLSNG